MKSYCDTEGWVFAIVKHEEANVWVKDTLLFKETNKMVCLFPKKWMNIAFLDYDFKNPIAGKTMHSPLHLA